MPCIVPAEILDAGTFQGFSPGPRIGIRQWLPGIRKHALRVLAELPAQDLHRGGVERYVAVLVPLANDRQCAAPFSEPDILAA